MDAPTTPARSERVNKKILMTPIKKSIKYLNRSIDNNAHLQKEKAAFKSLNNSCTNSRGKNLKKNFDFSAKTDKNLKNN
jgi:hypothetical protein